MQQLLNQASQAKTEVLLVAPFIKLSVLDEIVRALDDRVRLHVATRWRVEEIQAGVSDIEIFELIRDRDLSSLALANHLHAKYYRFDDFVYTGSANLTQTGLGIVGDAIEILEQRSAGLSLEFENRVTSASLEVNQGIYEVFRALPEREAMDVLTPPIQTKWFPEFRNPHDLWLVYSTQNYPDVSAEAARRDLGALGVPRDLDQQAFLQRIKVGLLGQSILSETIAYLDKPKRFGEFRRWVALTLGKSDATSEAQSLLRWIDAFLPELVSFESSPYSEVIRKRW